MRQFERKGRRRRRHHLLQFIPRRFVALSRSGRTRRRSPLFHPYSTEMEQKAFSSYYLCVCLMIMKSWRPKHTHKRTRPPGWHTVDIKLLRLAAAAAVVIISSDYTYLSPCVRDRPPQHKIIGINSNETTSLNPFCQTSNKLHNSLSKKKSSEYVIEMWCHLVCVYQGVVIFYFGQNVIEELSDSWLNSWGNM